jgi:hypothetical protein
LIRCVVHVKERHLGGSKWIFLEELLENPLSIFCQISLLGFGPISTSVQDFFILELLSGETASLDELGACGK